MTLSDFAKYSVARSIVQSLRQLSFLSSIDICFADVGRGEKERGREKGRGGEETTTCHEANKPRRSVIIRCVLSRMFCTLVVMTRNNMPRWQARWHVESRAPTIWIRPRRQPRRV